MRLVTDVRERRVEAHGYMWGQEDHSHWRSLIHQPQTAELSRSSGGRGSDELRRRDQQDVRIRAGLAQVCLPPTKQDQVRFSSGVSARTKQGHWLGSIFKRCNIIWTKDKSLRSRQALGRLAQGRITVFWGLEPGTIGLRVEPPTPYLVHYVQIMHIYEESLMVESWLSSGFAFQMYGFSISPPDSWSGYKRNLSLM